MTEFFSERAKNFHITTRFARGTSFADVVLAEIVFIDFGNRCELGIIETQNKSRKGFLFCAEEKANCLAFGKDEKSFSLRI